MQTLSEIRPVKEKAEDAILRQSGVTGVDIGHKYVNGVKTDELAIRVFVAQKKTPQDVAKKDLIPTTIDGVKTDVIETVFVPHPLSRPVEEFQLQADTSVYDPLKGGISIGPCRAVGGYVYVGTLGCIVRDKTTNQPMMLSNFHVMCIDNGWSVGDQMCQPGRVDGGQCPSQVVGTLQRAVLTDTVDGAVANITARGNACEIQEIGAINGTGAASLNMAVRKRGRTTGLTYGNVSSVDLSVNIDYGNGIGVKTLKHQIGIKPDPAHSAKFGDHGDSGSVVIDGSGKVVGLYFAGANDGSMGIANPIQNVLDALNINMCSAVKKIELKEHKDVIKDAKIEVKEHKPEIKEHKEVFKDLKDHKVEVKEHKVEKVEHKDFKELEKIHPDKIQKELEKPDPDKTIKEKDKDKDLVEGGFPGGPGDPGPILSGPSAGSSTLKPAFKEKFEHKEFKIEKIEKFEHKEFKPEKTEKPEKEKDKDIKDKEKELKFEKVEIKERKELIKEIEKTPLDKPIKEKDKDKDIFEGGPGNPGDPGPIFSGLQVDASLMKHPKEKVEIKEFLKHEKIEKIEKHEHKEHPKIEKLEKHEKPEKPEKEKPEKEKPEKEKPEKEKDKDFKDVKDKEKELKQEKVEGKDFKEIEKTHVDKLQKEIEKIQPEKPIKEKDKDKDIVEGGPGNPGDPGPIFGGGGFGHFIGWNLRPDLSMGALNREPDAQTAKSAGFEKNKEG